MLSGKKRKKNSLPEGLDVFTAPDVSCQIIFQNGYSRCEMQPAHLKVSQNVIKFEFYLPPIIFVYLANNVCGLVAVFIGMS